MLWRHWQRRDFQLKIPIDPEVQAVVQPIRRVPYHLRDKLSDKLDELVKLDIIEKVSGPSLWVSPVVVVPKPSGDIRLRQANMAVTRERHPILNIDEVLQDLYRSKFFSKLDLNSAYHQIEFITWIQRYYYIWYTPRTVPVQTTHVRYKLCNRDVPEGTWPSPARVRWSPQHSWWCDSSCTHWRGTWQEIWECGQSIE